MIGEKDLQVQRRRLVFPAAPLFLAAPRHIRSMPLPDLTEDEHAELVRLLRDAIAAEPYRIGPRMSKLPRHAALPARGPRQDR